jgi:hypothetical protein
MQFWTDTVLVLANLRHLNNNNDDDDDDDNNNNNNNNPYKKLPYWEHHTS